MKGVKILSQSIILVGVFCFSFSFTTTVLDLICWHSKYCRKVEQEMTMPND